MAPESVQLRQEHITCQGEFLTIAFLGRGKGCFLLVLELALETIRLSCSPLKHKTPGASRAVCLSCQKNRLGFDKNDTFLCSSTHEVTQPGSDMHRKLAGISFSGTTVVGTDLSGCFWAAEVWQHQHKNPEHSSTQGTETSGAARFSKRKIPNHEIWQTKVNFNCVMLQSGIFSSRCLQHNSLGCLHCSDRTGGDGFKLKRNI